MMMSNLGAYYSSAVADLLAFFAANGITPKLGADFQKESGSELYKSLGTQRTFAEMFPIYASSSNKTMVDSDGLLKWAPHNLVTYSEQFDNLDWGRFRSSVSANVITAPDGNLTADKIIPTTASGSHGVLQDAGVLPCTVTVSLQAGGYDFVAIGFNNDTPAVTTDSVFDIANGTLVSSGSDVASHLITDKGGGWYEITASSSASATFSALRVSVMSSSTDVTFVGDGTSGIYLWGAHLYRSDLGGMVNNPDRNDSYVPTTTTARYLPRRNHHVWDGSAWVNRGLRYETEQRTNLLLNSGTLATQDVTVTNEPHTIHFTGTGEITLSGAATGTLTGTAAGEGNRVSLTFTPTAGTLTVTVSGTVTNGQLEVGQTPSSCIPTAGATVTRAAESGLTIPAALVPYDSAEVSAALVGLETYADQGTAAQVTLMDWRLDANNRITLTLDTDGAKTGTLTLTMVNAGTSASISATAELTPGVNTAYSVAWRATDSEINIALNGTAETALATANGLPDLSGSDVALDGMGAKSQVLNWDADIGDTGIEEASS